MSTEFLQFTEDTLVAGGVWKKPVETHPMKRQFPEKEEDEEEEEEEE